MRFSQGAEPDKAEANWGLRCNAMDVCYGAVVSAIVLKKSKITLGNSREIKNKQ